VHEEGFEPTKPFGISILGRFKKFSCVITFYLFCFYLLLFLLLFGGFSYLIEKGVAVSKTFFLHNRRYFPALAE
jgi:hypothetical protein